MQIVHTTDYLKYDLGPGHPTRPVRAENLVRLVEEAGLLGDLVPPVSATYDELRLVHSEDYIAQVVSGWHDEWEGHRPFLHGLASLIVGGTLAAARRIRDSEVRRVFHPMGAKHHAQRDTASGFCIYNDMAIAASVLVEDGMKVLYVDWDAHHGDGVEFLLAGVPNTLTGSIHNGTIFPGTGQEHRPDVNAYNWPLAYNAKGPTMLSALNELLKIGADFDPDIVLLAAGADGHRKDPLGGLGYEVSDFAKAARRVSDFSYDHCAGRLLVGGGGGYRADDVTPQVWFEVYKALAADGARQ
jgi:acetoin utilization protein AcuC